MLRILVVLAAAAICAASASAPKQRAIKTTTTVTASSTDTWTALTELLAAREWKLVTSEQAAGLLETEWVPIDSGHADCGTNALATKDRDTKAHIVMRVKSDAAGTAIAIEAKYKRLRKFDDQAREVTCTSKGTLETELFADIDSRLKVLAVKRENAQAEAARAPFYCVAAKADPNLAACARHESGCEAQRTEIQKTIGEATPCTKAEKATCFIGTNADGVQTEQCYPTPELCTSNRTKLTAPPAKLKDPGECS